MLQEYNLTCQSLLIKGPFCVLLLQSEGGTVEERVKYSGMFFYKNLCFIYLLQEILIKTIDLEKDDVFMPSCITGDLSDSH